MRSPMHSTVWALSSDNRCSKSNILLSVQPVQSAVAIWLVKKSGDVAANRWFKRGELRRIAGAAQVPHRGRGEVLIAVADRDWHVDIFDFRRLAEHVEHGR